VPLVNVFFKNYGFIKSLAKIRKSKTPEEEIINCQKRINLISNATKEKLLALSEI